MQPPPGAKKSNAPLVVGVVVVLIIGVAVYFMYFKGGDSPSPTPAPAADDPGSRTTGGDGNDSGPIVKPKLTFSKLVKIGGGGIEYIDCDDANLYGSNKQDVYQMSIPKC